MKFRLVAIFAVFVLACAAGAWGDDTPAPPATQPAHKMELPPGFHVVTVGDRSALCQPQDDSWVKQTLSSVPPATRPSTMPSDMIATIGRNRAELVGEMTRDLGLADKKSPDEFLDTKLLPELARTSALKPTIYYFIATRDQVADLMAGGWSDPLFHYIRFAHNVSYTPRVILSPDQPMDDLVWWVEVHDGDTTATRQDALSTEVQFFEGNMVVQVSVMGRNQIEHMLEQFIDSTVMQPLKLPSADEWFDLGASSIFAIKYCALATGDSRTKWTEQLLGPPDAPRNYVGLDLMNPLSPAQIRPEYVMAYESAVLRKGALTVNDLISRAGEPALAKILPVLKANPPATPRQMIKAIEDATGVDLTADLMPDYGDSATRPAN
jgi:hypothetical protein